MLISEVVRFWFYWLLDPNEKANMMCWSSLINLFEKVKMSNDTRSTFKGDILLREIKRNKLSNDAIPHEHRTHVSRGGNDL